MGGKLYFSYQIIIKFQNMGIDRVGPSPEEMGLKPGQRRDDDDEDSSYVDFAEGKFGKSSDGQEPNQPDGLETGPVFTLGQSVRVVRSSGDAERDWMGTGIDEKKKVVRVSKDSDGKTLFKTLPVSELAEMQLAGPAQPEDQLEKRRKFGKGQIVKVLRSSGAVETDWTVSGVDLEKKIVRVLNNDKTLEKDVPVDELEKWQTNLNLKKK